MIGHYILYKKKKSINFAYNINTAKYNLELGTYYTYIGILYEHRGKNAIQIIWIFI